MKYSSQAVPAVSSDINHVTWKLCSAWKITQRSPRSNYAGLVYDLSAHSHYLPLQPLNFTLLITSKTRWEWVQCSLFLFSAFCHSLSSLSRAGSLGQQRSPDLPLCSSSEGTPRLPQVSQEIKYLEHPTQTTGFPLLSLPESLWRRLKAGTRQLSPTGCTNKQNSILLRHEFYFFMG